MRIFIFIFFPNAVEIDDLKKITNSLTVLCSEKQKQEKVRLLRFSVTTTLSAKDADLENGNRSNAELNCRFCYM